MSAFLCWWVLIGFFALIITTLAHAFVRAVRRSVAKIEGRNRCVYCASHLRNVHGHYAPVCSRCQALQPWAVR